MTMTITMTNASRANRRFASPRSRALARAHGLDLQKLAGSGPNGRIVRLDVEAALKSPASGALDAVERPTRHEDAPLTLGRKLIARRLTESMQHAPHFYARIDCCIDGILALRATQVSRLAQEGLKLSINDFVIHAAAQTLREVPAVNVAFGATAIRHFAQVHIAVAVAVPNGLVTPVLEDADCKGVAAISREMRALATQARAGSLPPGASAGGTFSISNLGGQGVREFTAIINPPQAAILAVGAAEQRTVVRAGQIAVATMMTVTLSCDHRAIDGELAGRWLTVFRRHIESVDADVVWA